MKTCVWCGDDKSQCDCDERLHCPKAGEVGHWLCGFCSEHAAPRFVCHCMPEVKRTEPAEAKAE